MPRAVSIAAQKAGGGVYLLCFSAAIGNDNHRARHYLGFAKSNIYNRVTQHRAASCRSASITRAAIKAGVKLKVTRIWPRADRNFERSLKNRKNHAALCPCCSAAFKERTNARRRL